MNHTTNYNLPQWEDADRVTRADVNAAMSAIDAAMAGLGQYHIEVQRYAGTGKYGSENPVTLTFTGTPVAAIIFGDLSVSFVGDSKVLVLIRSSVFSDYTIGLSRLNLSYSDNSFSFYSLVSASDQSNYKDKTYLVVALCS